MHERYGNFLRTVDRVARPKAAAMRVQAHQVALATDELRRATDTLGALARHLQPVEPTGLITAVQAPAQAPVVADLNSQYDDQTRAVLRRIMRPGDSAVDVGAHEGLVLDYILEAAPGERHFAFEPIPHMAEGLRARFPSVEVHELALAAEDGEATFHHVVSNPAYSGLIQRRFDREHEDVVITKVRVARLDDILPDDVVIRCLKIDVEGGELGVLTGGLHTLQTHRPYVIFEHGLGASDHYGTRPEMIADVLAQAGLRVNLLSRWLDGHEPFDRAEFVRQYETNENYYFLAHP